MIRLYTFPVSGWLLIEPVVWYGGGGLSYVKLFFILEFSEIGAGEGAPE